MLILVKTPTITFSLDVQPDESTDVLYTKVAERTEYKPFQFELLFAGEKISGNVASNGIKKETTIHMNVIKVLKYMIMHEGVEHQVSLPNNDGLNIGHLMTLRGEIPALATHQLQVMKGGSVQGRHLSLQQSFSNNDTVEITFGAENAVKSKSFASKSSSSASESVSHAAAVEEDTQFDQDALLNSFVEASMSSDVEIVFCFDTTGSMSSIIASVRAQVEKTVSRLMKDIPNIRIGIMGLGDYCDGRNVITTLDLSQDVNELVAFIKKVPGTSGGDAPEAYEFALKKAKELTWSQHTSKAFVMIGDSNPHEPSHTNLNINWFAECDDLYDMGVKIYGVKALGSSVFYEDIAERTGGICINFNRFELITEMFMMICYREASKDKFNAYQKEINSGDGVTAEMTSIMDDLNKENFTVVKQEDIDAAKKEPELETTTTTTTTTNTTDAPAAPKKNVIVRQYGHPTKMKKPNESWYNHDLDKVTKPTYVYNEELGYFEGAGSSAISTISTTLAIPPKPPVKLADGTMSACTAAKMFASTFSKVDKSRRTKPATAYIFGDSYTGKTVFADSIRFVSKNISFIEKSYLVKHELESTALMVVCFDYENQNSLDNVPTYLAEIRKRDPSKPVIVVGLRSDAVPASRLAEVNLDEFKLAFSCLACYSYRRTFNHADINDIVKDIEKSLKSRQSCSIM
eukprot:gene12630-14827_t